MRRDIFQVADDSLRWNENLRATDVPEQRARGACLGTAHSLLTDAVRLVVVGRAEEARPYFHAVIELGNAAIEEGETYVYETPEIAAFFASRDAFLAAWALQLPLAQEVADFALSTFAAVAEPADYAAEHPGIALAGGLLLAVHADSPGLLVETLAARAPCGDDHVWCRCFEICWRYAHGEPSAEAVEQFFNAFVRSNDLYSVAARECSIPVAMSIAELRNRSGNYGLPPFDVLRTINSAAAAKE